MSRMSYVFAGIAIAAAMYADHRRTDPCDPAALGALADDCDHIAHDDTRAACITVVISRRNACEAEP